MSRLVYLSNKNVSEEIGIYIKLKCDCKTLKGNIESNTQNEDIQKNHNIEN
jgi:hypothetical protein